jgi:hypothetical protein
VWITALLFNRQKLRSGPTVDELTPFYSLTDSRALRKGTAVNHILNLPNRVSQSRSVDHCTSFNRQKLWVGHELTPFYNLTGSRLTFALRKTTAVKDILNLPNRASKQKVWILVRDSIAWSSSGSTPWMNSLPSMTRQTSGCCACLEPLCLSKLTMPACCNWGYGFVISKGVVIRREDVCFSVYVEG